MLRVLRYLVWTLVWFVGLSLALVVIYRFVPVPVTATMLMDENGITDVPASELPVPNNYRRVHIA